MNKIMKSLGLLAVIIILCAIVARVFSGAETLADYAEKNPETAYATPLKTLAPETPSPTPALLPSAPPVETAVPADDPAPTPVSKDREVYQPDFYKEPLDEILIARISGISYPLSLEEAEALTAQPDAVPVINVMSEGESAEVSYDELRHLMVLHYDFNGEVQTGELICNQAIADDLLEIFYELYLNEYRIEKIRLIEDYNGDDTLSMLDNNTSCFNYRVVDGSTNLSKHALGLAIDINPFYNPYVVFQKDGSTYISPKGSEVYTDRSKDFPYKIDEIDLCYKLFKEHDFIWGGNWNSMKDYQHFQKTLQ